MVSSKKWLQLIVLLIAFELPIRAEIVAFPGAEGYGRYAQGGRG